MIKLYTPRISSSVLLIIMLCVSVTNVSGQANTKQADALYEMGLFLGTDKGYELKSTFTREQAAVMLVRFLGAEKELDSNTYITHFSDVSQDRWSVNYVMYCYENEITKGTGEDTFSPDIPISGSEFVTLLLRSMGYDVDPQQAYQRGVEVNLFSTNYVSVLQSMDDFLRNDAVFISYRALFVATANGNTLSDKLITQGVITKEQVEKNNVIAEAENMDDILKYFLD